MMGIRHFRLFATMLVLAVAATGCGTLQVGIEDPFRDLIPPTLTEIPPGRSTELVAVTPTDAPPDLLPLALFFFAPDSAGLTQVFRMERDGTTTRQLTFEPFGVREYDVSPADGSVAFVGQSRFVYLDDGGIGYEGDNQLLMVDADGSNRRVLVEGGPIVSPYFYEVRRPVFSPSGETLAYYYKGLNLYSLSTGMSNLVIRDLYEEIQILNGVERALPIETYWPVGFSPDGLKLVVGLGYFEGGSMAIYYPAAKTLIPLRGVEESGICYWVCGGAGWAADSRSFYSVNSQNDFSFPTGGMWKVDAGTGAITTLIPLTEGDGTINLPEGPFLAPDGQLYYFFINYEESAASPLDRAPLQLVRSEPDGVTGRTVLLPDTFELMNGALWAPDASFVIVIYAPGAEVYDGGEAHIIYLDGRPDVFLMEFAQALKWGP